MLKLEKEYLQQTWNYYQSQSVPFISPGNYNSWFLHLCISTTQANASGRTPLMADVTHKLNSVRPWSKFAPGDFNNYNLGMVLKTYE